jgi:hypothetical protein
MVTELLISEVSKEIARTERKVKPGLAEKELKKLTDYISLLIFIEHSLKQFKS